jgi:hypothetical protein
VRSVETTGLTDLPADDARQRHHAGEISLRVFLGDDIQHLRAMLLPMLLKIGEEGS